MTSVLTNLVHQKHGKTIHLALTLLLNLTISRADSCRLCSASCLFRSSLCCCMNSSSSSLCRRNSSTCARISTCTAAQGQVNDMRSQENTYMCCHHHHHHHHHHRLSLKCEGRWGTTDDFATSFLHSSLFSTALWDLPNSKLVHFLMLSSHLFLCLPCLLPSFTVPCKMVLARPNQRET